jgi:hypothetical protein
MTRLTDALHATLDRRATTQQVAAIILTHAAAPVRFGLVETGLLESAAGRPIHETERWMPFQAPLRPRSAWSPSMVNLTMMPDDFERTVDAGPQLDFVKREFSDVRNIAWPGALDWDALRDLIDRLGEPYGWTARSTWLDRLTASELHSRFPGLSKRRYNRKMRALLHLADKAVRVGDHERQRRFVLIGHSGFACDITRAQFAASPDAAMFIAYYVARRNRRRQFTLAGKENPMDRLAEALLSRCQLAPAASPASTDWSLVAKVLPSREVLSYLTDQQCGELSGAWFRVMREAAELLAVLWGELGSGVDRRRMIVRRGMDSSGWNELAGAYNACRTGWLNATILVSPALIAPCLPGKVMRLMAADLAWWHEVSGGDVDPGTLVWAELPLPWDVLRLDAACTAETVEAACRAHGLDPRLSGWVGHRLSGLVADITPTPELVHGVTIGDPLWAQLLRKAGVFGGASKRSTPEARMLRAAADAQGAIVSELPSRAQLMSEMIDKDNPFGV